MDHAVLAECLSKKYGIRSTDFDWLRSYLRDRRQNVLFDGVLSTAHFLSCCFPLGSVLGSLLFLVYTADLGELAVSLGLSYHVYADDSQLFTLGLHRQLQSSGAEWSLVFSESQNECAPTDCDSTSGRRTSCGVRPADGASISIPVS